MKEKRINIFRELRLLACGLLFSLIFWLTPKNDPEGLIIIESIHFWASKSKEYLINTNRKLREYNNDHHNGGKY